MVKPLIKTSRNSNSIPESVLFIKMWWALSAANGMGSVVVHQIRILGGSSKQRLLYGREKKGPRAVNPVAGGMFMEDTAVGKAAS